MAEDMNGREGRAVRTLPLEKTLEIMKQHGVF
jgi:hypothetical protein